MTAKRIAFGKFLNCGQTCVAPDYILCDSSIKDEFITALKTEINKQFGIEPLKNDNYGKIINAKHFERLTKPLALYIFSSDKKTWIDLPIRYQPYKSQLFGKLMHWLLR